MSKKTTAPNPKLLRSSAEARLVNALAAEPTTRSADEILHELQVHQIELEMQNENLQQAHLVLEESRDRYLELYEFAPLGFLTLTCNGMISEANLTGTAQLGVERKKLLHSRFANFVVPEDHECWDRYFMSVIERSEKQNCELS